MWRGTAPLPTHHQHHQTAPPPRTHSSARLRACCGKLTPPKLVRLLSDIRRRPEGFLDTSDSESIPGVWLSAGIGPALASALGIEDAELSAVSTPPFDSSGPLWLSLAAPSPAPPPRSPLSAPFFSLPSPGTSSESICWSAASDTAESSAGPPVPASSGFLSALGAAIPGTVEALRGNQPRPLPRPKALHSAWFLPKSSGRGTLSFSERTLGDSLLGNRRSFAVRSPPARRIPHTGPPRSDALGHRPPLHGVSWPSLTGVASSQA